MADGDIELSRTAERLWRIGDLSWKLDDHQLHRIYDPYREWEQEFRKQPRTGIARCWMLDAGRQVGKTFTVDLVKVEDCIRYPGTKHLIAAAEEVNLKEFVIPNIDAIIADGPDDVRPRFMTSRLGMKAGYFFPNGSVLKLVGIDKNPDGLRGPKLHGAVISEAAFVRKLKRTIGGIIYPQFQRTPLSTLILESSAPDNPEHEFDTVFKPDCEARRAYVFLTIDDNTALTHDEKREFVSAAEAIDPDDAQREYYGVRVRNRTKVVVPEFEVAQHVRESPRPAHAVAMAAMDPGMRDLFALVWGYWDARRAKLVVERDWCARNTSTARVAEVIRATELELYGDAAELARPKPFGIAKPEGFSYWDGKEFRANPIQRVSDTEARLIGDLTNDYGIGVMNTLKDDKEAALYALRNAFRADKLEVHPRCVQLIAHLNAARWNEQRTDYERSEAHGHYDLLDALVYLWRMVQPIRSIDPFPPAFVDRADRRVLFMQPPTAANHQTQKLRDAFGGGRRSSWR